MEVWGVSGAHAFSFAIYSTRERALEAMVAEAREWRKEGQDDWPCHYWLHRLAVDVPAEGREAGPESVYAYRDGRIKFTGGRIERIA